MPLLKKAAPASKKKSLSFSVDCSKPVEDRIMDMGQFEKFLSEKIKVGGKAGASRVLSAPPLRPSAVGRRSTVTI